MVGLNVRPYFAARMAMREYLLALQEYNVRWWSSLRINQLRGTPSTALPATGGGADRCTFNRAMRMIYRVNVVGKPKVGRRLSGMGATQRDPTWYRAYYAPPLLHLQSSGVVVLQQELGTIQGGQGTEPPRLGGGRRVQVTPLVDRPPMEADVASQEDEGMASTSSDDEETSDDATDTQEDSDSS